MSDQTYFLLNGKYFSQEDIKKGKFTPGTSFENDVLTFAHQWLKGDSSFIFQTSGSTGKPKVLEITRKQILASIENTANALDLSSGDKALLCIPAANTGGKMMVARCLQLGMSLEAVEPDANPFKNFLNTPDFVALVPLQLAQIIKNPNLHPLLNKVKKVIVGGAAVSPDLRKEIQQFQPAIYATYGMTETVSHIALQRLNGPNQSDLFEILSNITVSLTENGCLKIKGPVTNNKWVSTNDQVEIIQQRYIRWNGRMDNIINSGGVKIQPEIVEEQVAEAINNMTNQAFFVTGLPDPKLGEKVVLIFEGAQPPAGILSKLQKAIEENVHGFQKPREIVFLQKFNYTAAGKLDRKNTINQLNPMQ